MHRWVDRLTEEDRAEEFVHTTPEQLAAHVGDVRCVDPVTLARIAALVLRNDQDQWQEAA